jgi:hypothetical protein
MTAIDQPSANLVTAMQCERIAISCADRRCGRDYPLRIGGLPLEGQIRFPRHSGEDMSSIDEIYHAYG